MKGIKSLTAGHWFGHKGSNLDLTGQNRLSCHWTMPEKDSRFGRRDLNPNTKIQSLGSCQLDDTRAK